MKANQKISIEFCTDETIIRLDGGNYSLVKNNDTKYEYNTKYKNNDSLISKYDFDCTLSIDTNNGLDNDKFNKAFGIDKFKIPDKYDIKVSKLIPCKWHKKKRINKKMLKKHGHPNYVHKFETVKGWKLHSYTNGEFEFVKDGDKL